MNNNLEIERKFITDLDLFFKLAYNEHATVKEIVQNYINFFNFSIRFRLVYTHSINKYEGLITIKSKNIGLIRKEYEFNCNISLIKFILNLFNTPHLKKTRYELNLNYLKQDYKYFVDYFKDIDLTLTEVELLSPDIKINILPFMLTEVTNKPEYYNENLIKNVKN